MLALKKIMRRSLCAFLFMCSALLSAQTASTVSEYQVKAVCLFNFTQFVEWPATSFPAEQSPMVIGIIGENPFGTYLEETVADEKVNGHPLIVRYYKRVEDIDMCHVLFINLNETNKIRDVITGLKGRNILTVTNQTSSSKQEEIIRFFIKNNKMQFQINLEAAKDANLTISSKLLKLARIFTP